MKTHSEIIVEYKTLLGVAMCELFRADGRQAKIEENPLGSGENVEFMVRVDDRIVERATGKTPVEALDKLYFNLRVRCFATSVGNRERSDLLRGTMKALRKIAWELHCLQQLP